MKERRGGRQRERKTEKRQRDEGKERGEKNRGKGGMKNENMRVYSTCKFRTTERELSWVQGAVAE
jgi:hypothetical protein